MDCSFQKIKVESTEFRTRDHQGPDRCDFIDRVIDLLWLMGSRRDIIPDDIMNETLAQIVDILKQQDHQSKLGDEHNVTRKENLMRKLLIELQNKPQGNFGINFFLS